MIVFVLPSVGFVNPKGCGSRPLPPGQRVNAGYPGISAEECRRLGNCYDSTCGKNCVWCYKPGKWLHGLLASFSIVPFVASLCR